MNAVHTESSQGEVEPIDGPISFPLINPNRAIVLLYNALVLTLCINDFNVHRVLVDTSSAVDLLQLPVRAGLVTQRVLFSVVEDLGPYIAIVGRT